METLKKIVSNQYFPAGAVLTAVILFWAVGMLGGLSLLHNNQPPLTTLTWMLFVYMAAVLTPIAGLMAAVDLYRRWRRNRAAAESAVAENATAETVSPAASTASTEAILVGSQRAEAHVPAEAAGTRSQQPPLSEQPAQQQPAQQKPAPKKPIQKKQGKKAA
ncbi:hypothetical protein DXK94_07285 [Arthrobacter sp. RT-1]|uniref:hypothetical protein n=1 Tax=Arthrobacter sp. RT-1 TaxID=2292263 RepID=UPI000E1F960E|nr:hypothetical protein [Arthrobacter sp. RT-1]RDV10964.1 hypothetical protein DXK94_07285 [Arthrobacter sp. RT-1]